MDIHETDFVRARDQDARALGALIHTHATAHAEDLLGHGVTPATLAARVQDFADALGQPRHAIAERKIATQAINDLFAQIDALLNDQLDRLALQFKGTPFYTEYRAARNIIGP